jgi:hypothetical protein
MRGVVPLITQTEEWDEDVHFPQCSKPAISYGFEADKAVDLDRAKLVTVLRIRPPAILFLPMTDVVI